ncbi:Protein nud1 [Parahypoxylon ruwenzoriense]
MGHHAWLDSLSEDWVSQPGSDDASQERVPSLSSSRASLNRRSLREPLSRIPRFNPGNAPTRKLPQHARNSSAHTHNNSSAINALNERSLNDINIQGSQRGPAKSPRENRFVQRGRYLSRSASASTTASVLHNTVQHNKSQSASPSKSRERVPEWKRRLVYGELNYGESKDLFSSAGTGLENIFRPPMARESTGDETADNEEVAVNDSTLPSSPPPYSRPVQRRSKGYEYEALEPSTDRSQSRRTNPPPERTTFRWTGSDTQGSSRRVRLAPDGHHDREETGAGSKPGQKSVSFSYPNNSLDVSRKVSGQSDVRNEDLSPILLSRHDAGDGKVSFAPVELPAEQLRKRLEKLRRNQMLLDAEGDSYLEQEEDAAADGSRVLETTDDFANNGGFLNLRRGGRSGEGSFRRRPLSPPLNNDTSEMLPESSLQASTPKQFPTIRIDRVASADRKYNPEPPSSPVVPPPPYPSPEKRLQLPSAQSGSPLKLFGPYDTFTNQTLLRRISQFEDQMTDSPSRSVGVETSALSMQESPSKLDTTNEGFAAESSPKKTLQTSRRGHPDDLGAVSIFGAGELDGYEFNEDITLTSCDQSQLTDKENVAPEDDSIRPSHPFKFQIHQDLSLDGASLIVQRRRHRPPSSALSPRRGLGLSRFLGSSRPQSSSYPIALNHGVQATPRRDGSEGKRPRTSPSKDPTPKRRRTLHRSDIAYGLEDEPPVIGSVRSSHQNMQSIIGRKRQDSHRNEWHQAASPNVLAARQILRPRSPTPGQRSSAARERQPLKTLVAKPDHQSSISAPSRAPETFIRDFAVDGSGRTSMKTQDFFDAAEEIMAMIRSKARPRNDLSSVEESEAETTEKPSLIAPGDDESSFQESTGEPFSRPPSREGPPLTRVPTHQENLELANRLKKYEERSDLGEIITNSMQSMGRIREAINKANSLTESLQQSVLSQKAWYSPTDDRDVISDLFNIRISRNPDHLELGENIAEFPSNGTRSIGASTGHSIPTASSRGSGSGGFIVPDAVSQLIGDQVGNMVFDKENNVWRKVKKSRPISDSRNILPSEDSEDPFASIPDLSVDMVRETRTLELATKRDQEHHGQSPQEATSPGNSADSSTVTQESFDARSSVGHTKETLTKITQIIETAVEDDKEIEHEISIHEDRIQKSSSSRKRNLTISFSSPIASVIQDIAHHQSDNDNADQELDFLDQSLEDVATESLKRGRHPKSTRSVGGSATRPRSRSGSQGLTRNLSVRGQDFFPRPVSRIDEQDEDATREHVESEERQISFGEESSLDCAEAEDKRNTSLSVVVTPAPAKTSAGSATPIIGQYVGTLSLTPLSEFTMNHADRSCGLEVSYVVGDRYLATGDGSKKIMSKAIQCLVEKITEIEPFEPDWESMRELDINNKQLTTLHMLDEFCTGIVTLDASSNMIEHLDGIPESVRNLRVTNNHLSELTAWGHLMNLQYVDVSNNQINSLHAFRDLVHLRSLRADNNHITSLDGIKLHDSLQVLRVRGNLLSEVNLDGTRLQRLAELDLEDNQIISIQGIEQLACLTTLNLQDNYLPSFAPSADVSVTNLKYLTLSGNDLTVLDLAPFPSLRLLHADRNQLTNITGFSRCRRLDSLSLREQRGEVPLDASFLDAAYEIRKLFLSGNLLSAFDPSVDFLNLQYLELANCGLQSLPPDLGQLMPNLRVLNLNMNAIEDITALRYIPRLKKLLVASNRLADAGQVADVLAGFPHLSRLDFRDNPATLGFYAPIQTLVPVDDDDDSGKTSGKGGRTFDPFVLPDADPGRDDKFASRSDMGTRMRRRFYEMIVLDRCRRLKVLDGLPVVGGADAAKKTKKRDKVWQALIRSGVIEDDDDDDDRPDKDGDGEKERNESEDASSLQ